MFVMFIILDLCTIYDDVYLLKWLHNYDFTGFESNVNEYDGDDESD